MTARWCSPNVAPNSLARLILCYLSLETSFIDSVNDADVRLPLQKTLREGRSAFTKGFYVMPKTNELTKVKQEVDDIYDVFKTLAFIKGESLQAQKLVGFITKSDVDSDDEFFRRFGAADQVVKNFAGVRGDMGLTADVAAKTTMTMFEKSPMIRNFVYDNDVELRSSYAFNYLFNMVNWQTLGSLRHNLNKYYNGNFKFISICKLDEMAEAVKRAIGMRLDKLVDIPYNVMDVVDHSDKNRKLFKHYGLNLFQSGVRRKVSQIFDDVIVDIANLRPRVQDIDETFNVFKTIEAGFVKTRSTKHKSTKKAKFDTYYRQTKET